MISNGLFKIGEVEHEIRLPYVDPMNFIDFTIFTEKYKSKNATFDDLNQGGLNKIKSHFDDLYNKLENYVKEISFSEQSAILLINDFFNRNDFGPKIEVKGDEKEFYRKLGWKVYSLSERLKNINEHTEIGDLNNIGELMLNYSRVLGGIQSTGISKRHNSIA